jgi:hypothetical protein
MQALTGCRDRLGWPAETTERHMKDTDGNRKWNSVWFSHDVQRLLASLAERGIRPPVTPYPRWPHTTPFTPLPSRPRAADRLPAAT